MKPLDFAKAAGLGALILILDLVIATVVITVWSLLVDPGHPEAYYHALAPTLATWSSRIAGPLLFAGLMWFYARRRPERNALLFAVVVWAAYVVFDGAVVAYKDFFTLAIASVLGLKLAGALAGAVLAGRGRRGQAS